MSKLFGVGKHDKFLERNGRNFSCIKCSGKTFTCIRYARIHARTHDEVGQVSIAAAQKKYRDENPEKRVKTIEDSRQKAIARRQENDSPVRCGVGGCDFVTFDSKMISAHRRDSHPALYYANNPEGLEKRIEQKRTSDQNIAKKNAVQGYFKQHHGILSPKVHNSQETPAPATRSNHSKEVFNRIQSTFHEQNSRYVYVVLITDREASQMGLKKYLKTYARDESKEVLLYIGKGFKNGPAHYHTNSPRYSSLAKFFAIGKSCFELKVFEFSTGATITENIRNADSCEAYLQILGFAHGLCSKMPGFMNWKIANRRFERFAAKKYLSQNDIDEAMYLGTHLPFPFCLDNVENECKKQHNKDGFFKHYLKLHLDGEIKEFIPGDISKKARFDVYDMDSTSESD